MMTDFRKSIVGKLQNVDSKVESVQNVLTKVEKIAEKSVSSSPTTPSTYAGAAKKHLLIVKSTVDTQKAIEKKKEISEALEAEGIQIADAKFSEVGNVTLNFESEQQRDAAADKVDELESLSVKKAKKMFPKIIICNVNNDESKDELVQTMINRNSYLKSIDSIEEKIKVVFEKNAAGGTKHFILKCDPEVRGLIHKKGDSIKLKWGVYNVRDRYYATMCYHCLRYGHVKNGCRNKDNDPCCKKCAGHHLSDRCSSTEKKCINCVRAGKLDLNHFANDRCCPVLNAEVVRIKNMTENGY